MPSHNLVRTYSMLGYEKIPGSIVMQTNVKQTAHELIEQLNDQASWDDVIYEMVLRKEIEAELADSAAGQVTPAGDILKESGIQE